MANIILFPTHEDYCGNCIYNNKKTGACSNEQYKKNSYYVVCVWKRCPYRKSCKVNDKDI